MMHYYAEQPTDLLSGNFRAGRSRRYWPALVLLALAAGSSTPAPVGGGGQPAVVSAVPLRLAAAPVAPRVAPAPADTSFGVMAGIKADVRRRSFFLNADAKTGTLTAGNYAQHLTAAFGPSSYTVAGPAQDGAAPAWQVGFVLRSIGRTGAPSLALAATPAAPATHEGHASYAHPAFAVDYDNTPAGVRQTFRLAERPAGTGPVAVRLHLATTLHPELANKGALVFTAGRIPAPVLRYDSLKAWDAKGRVLPAHLRLDGPTALALVVDDANATYPVTIDPLASTPGTTLTGQNAGDTFATSVAGVGDLDGDGYGDLAVGAPGYSGGAGAVYLYRGSSTGLVPTAATLLQGSNTDNLGTSVAGAGDFNGDGYADLLIGAPGYANNVGVAYIYAGGPSFFTNPTANAAGRAGYTNSRGGSSVAGVGDVNGDGYDDFAYGCPAYSSNNGDVALVFGNASLNMNTATDAIGSGSIRLGASLAGLGDTNGDGYADLAAGAPGGNSVLVVQGANTTSFGSLNRFILTPSGGTSAGTSVAGPGDVNGDGYADLLIGAPGAGSSGSAYLYLGSTSLSGSSTQAAVFTTATPGESFGTAVSGAGDINGDGYADFAIGAPAYASNRGRVYVSLGSAVLANISNMPQTIEGETAGDQYGSSVSGGDANGDGYGDVLVGAPKYSSSTGRAYAYYGSPAALAAAPTATLAEPGAATGNAFGVSTADAGDVNGDGYADVLVGAYTANNGQGRAYLYLGSSTGLAATPTAITEPNAATNNYFGYSAAGAGDVNGDGYADVLVSAFRANNGQGRAYLYLGSSSGLATTPTTFSEPTPAPNNGFGNSVAGAGDVNGDGYADALVGAYFTSGGQGRAYLYLGSSSGLAATPTTLIEPGAATNNNFGYSVSGAGDLNGDGLADVLVGAQGGGSGQGRAYVYLGRSTGLATTPTTTLAEPTAASGNAFGNSVAGAGDVNGDGLADVLVGAKGPNTGQGRAYVYLGSSTGLATTPTATLAEPGAANGNAFGSSVSSAGDLNGDGYADVLVGAGGALSSSQGRAYAYLGSSSGLAATPTALTEPGAALGTSFGVSVAGVGDVDGDGYGDVLIGASNSSAQGRAYFWRGNQGVARSGALRLYDADYTPISASNRPASQFGIGLLARNPAGRIQARVVWEVMGPGQSFSHNSPITNSTAYTGRGTWTNLPASGTATELRALVTKRGRASKVRARLEYASSPLTAGPAAGTGGPASRVRYGPWTYVDAQQLGQSSSTATPLPVELTLFTASPEGPAAVRLAWTTASEKNSAVFEVERSPDGTVFARLGTVDAVGSSTASRTYGFVDAKLPGGAAPLYYRLKQVDNDGSFSYSPVRVVSRLGPAEGLALFPNPATAGATLTGGQPGLVVSVFDALGRLIATATADASGTAALGLPAGLPAGVYVVRAGQQAVRLTVE